MTTYTKRIGAIATGAALILIVAWALIIYRPQSANLAKAHKDKATAEQQITQLQSQVASLRQIYAHIPADTARYATLSAAIPDNPGLASAITELDKAAATSGLQIKSVNPTPPAAPTASPSGASAAGVPTIPISISASGTYEQAQSFMTLLASDPRVFVVNSVSYSSGQGASGTSLTIQMGASIFYAGQPTP